MSKESKTPAGNTAYQVRAVNEYIEVIAPTGHWTCYGKNCNEKINPSTWTRFVSHPRIPDGVYCAKCAGGF